MVQPDVASDEDDDEEDNKSGAENAEDREKTKFHVGWREGSLWEESWKPENSGYSLPDESLSEAKERGMSLKMPVPKRKSSRTTKRPVKRAATRRTGRKKGKGPPIWLMVSILVVIAGGAFWVFRLGENRKDSDDLQAEMIRMLRENPNAEVLELAPPTDSKKKP